MAVAVAWRCGTAGRAGPDVYGCTSSSAQTDLQPPGRCFPAGTAVNVDVLASGPDVPTLMIGAPATHPGAAYANSRTYALAAGANTITDPGGGMASLKYTGNGEKATVGFGQSTVLASWFQLGRTTEEEFQAVLDERDGSPQVELVAPYVFVTVTRESVLRYRNPDQGAILDLLEQVLASHAAVSGPDGRVPVRERGPAPFHMVE